MADMDDQLAVRYRVNVNKDIFEAWKILAESVGMMASMVQNDSDVSEQSIMDYVEMCDRIKTSVDRLREVTLDCIVRVEG